MLLFRNVRCRLCRPGDCWGTSAGRGRLRVKFFWLPAVGGRGKEFPAGEPINAGRCEPLLSAGDRRRDRGGGKRSGDVVSNTADGRPAASVVWRVRNGHRTRRHPLLRVDVQTRSTSGGNGQNHSQGGGGRHLRAMGGERSGCRSRSIGGAFNIADGCTRFRCNGASRWHRRFSDRPAIPRGLGIDHRRNRSTGGRAVHASGLRANLG